MACNPFNSREPKENDLALRQADASALPGAPVDVFLTRLPGSYVPAKHETGVTDKSVFVPLEPFYSPVYLGDAPLLTLPGTMEREPPFIDHSGATVATPCVVPYAWEEDDEDLRTIILDTVPDSEATPEEKALPGYVPNPGLFLSSKTMQIYGQTQEGIDIEDIEEDWYCQITTPGDSDWTAIGSPDNNEGTEFYATGPGTGTGVAAHVQEKYDDKNGVGFRWTYGQDVDDVFSSATVKTGSRYKILTRGVTSETLVDAGDILVGWECRIETTGNTDWIAMGAASDTPGTLFKCTAIGSGTGTATHIVYDIDYTTIGAANNNAGTEFTATGNGSGTGTVNIIWLKVEHCVVGQWYQMYVAGDTDWEAMGADPDDLSAEFECTVVGSGTGYATRLNPHTPHPILRTGQTRYTRISGAATGETFTGDAFIPGDAGDFGSGTLVVCAYRWGFILSERKRWRVAVKIGRATATWDKTLEQLTLECDTETATIYYSTDGGEPTTEYTGPISISTTATVRWKATAPYMVESDEWQTYLEYQDEMPPDDFETVYFSSLPAINNSGVTQAVRLPLQAALYVSADGTGNGEALDNPMPLDEAVGLASVDATAIESGLAYRIIRQKKQDGSGTATDFTLIGAPNNDTGTEFIATGAGTGDGAAMLIGKTKGTRTITATQITSADLVATKTRSEKRYRIKTIGSTNWKLIGAASNTIGLEFEATGAGTGTGTADQIVPVGTLQLKRGGSEPAGCARSNPNNPAPIDASEIIKDRWYKIVTLGTTNWTGYGAPCNAVGVEFVASVTGGTGTGTAGEIGAIEISHEADEVAATALADGDRCAIKDVGDTDWTAIGASASQVGIEFEASGAGTGTGKAWRRKWVHYTEPIEVGPCNVWVRRLRRTTSLTGEPPYTRDFLLPWFYGNVDLKTSWNSGTKLLTIAVEPADQLDAKYIDITYGETTAADNDYTGPIEITEPVTLKITCWHFARDIPLDVGTYSPDEIEVTIDPDTTADFDQTDTFNLTDTSYADRIMRQRADILWLAEGEYTTAVSSYEAIVVRGGYNEDYTERDIRNRKTEIVALNLGIPTGGGGSPVGAIDGVYADPGPLRAEVCYCCQIDATETLHQDETALMVFDGACYGCQASIAYTGGTGECAHIYLTLCSGEATDCTFAATVESADGWEQDSDDKNSRVEIHIGSMVRGTLALDATAGDGYNTSTPYGAGGSSSVLIEIGGTTETTGTITATSGDGGDSDDYMDMGQGGGSIIEVEVGDILGGSIAIDATTGNGGNSTWGGPFQWEGGSCLVWIQADALLGATVEIDATTGTGGTGPWTGGECGIEIDTDSCGCDSFSATCTKGTPGNDAPTWAMLTDHIVPTFLTPAAFAVSGINRGNGHYEHADAYEFDYLDGGGIEQRQGWWSGDKSSTATQVSPHGDGAPLAGYTAAHGTGIVRGRYWE